MVVRIVLGTAWALITGFAGGWLMLSPWALGQQPSAKDWTTVTQTEFFSGLGLVILAAIGLALVAAQSFAVLREAGVTDRREAPASGRNARAGADGAGAPSPGEFENTLMGLAQALTRELQSQSGSEPAPGQRGGVAGDPGPGHQQGAPEYPPAFRRLEG
jgi:hypothetical protein